MEKRFNMKAFGNNMDLAQLLEIAGVESNADSNGKAVQLTEAPVLRVGRLIDELAVAIYEEGREFTDVVDKLEQQYYHDAKSSR